MNKFNIFNEFQDPNSLIYTFSRFNQDYSYPSLSTAPTLLT